MHLHISDLNVGNLLGLMDPEYENSNFYHIREFYFLETWLKANAHVVTQVLAVRDRLLTTALFTSIIEPVNTKVCKVRTARLRG